MSETKSTPSETPVADVIGVTANAFIQGSLQKVREMHDAGMTDGTRKQFEAMGGFQAFLASDDGKKVLAMIEVSSTGLAIVHYLEVESSRRAAWEKQIEARLNGFPVT